MSTQTIGLLIGGLVPALMFGISNISMKQSTSLGISLPIYLIVVGTTVIAIGVLAMIFISPQMPTFAQSGSAIFAGALWGIGVFAITYAIQQFNTPLSVIAPLFNLNALITVLIALWIFSEWKEVRVPQLLIGSVLIVAGGVLVSKA